MADISKCHGHSEGTVCRVREQCYRFTAKASDYQSYVEPVDFQAVDGCENYWPNEDRNPKVAK